MTDREIHPPAARHPVTAEEHPMADAFTCPHCGRTSHHPRDVDQRYCGACHWWTGVPELYEPWRTARAARDGRCPSCECCPAGLCATALTEGTACLVLTPARPLADDAVVRCPCAPAVCHCEPPWHFRGIARCRHGRRRMAEPHGRTPSGKR